jgi:hypothetical protein
LYLQIALVAIVQWAMDALDGSAPGRFRHATAIVSISRDLRHGPSPLPS